LPVVQQAIITDLWSRESFSAAQPLLDLRLSRFANMDETLSRRFDLRQKQHLADNFHSAPPVYTKFRLRTHFGSPFNGDGYENNSPFLRMFQDVGKASFSPLFASEAGAPI
jgi:hypothetical protein